MNEDNQPPIHSNSHMENDNGRIKDTPVDGVEDYGSRMEDNPTRYCGWCDWESKKSENPNSMRLHIRNQHPDVIDEWLALMANVSTGKKKPVKAKATANISGVATTPKVEAPLSLADEDDVKNATTEALVAQAIERKFKQLARARQAKEEYEQPLREQQEYEQQQKDSIVSTFIREISATNRMLLQKEPKKDDSIDILKIITPLLEKLGDERAGREKDKTEFYKMMYESQMERNEQLDQNTAITRNNWDRLFNIIEREVERDIRDIRLEEKQLAMIQETEKTVKSEGVGAYVDPANIDDED